MCPFIIVYAQTDHEPVLTDLFKGSGLVGGVSEVGAEKIRHNIIIIS